MAFRPACADPKLLKETIRGEWDLNGNINFDLRIQIQSLFFFLILGLDLDCGSYYSDYGANAVIQGKVRESKIDKALRSLYFVLLRPGFFDGSPKFDSLGKDEICSENHINFAIQAAREGIFLLKNDNDTLPLDSHQIKTIAVVWLHANATDVMIGNHAGVPCRITTPIYAFKQHGKVIYENGCADVACKNDSLIFPAVQAASKADATIVGVGLDLSAEAESLDRVDLLLPGYQTQLINQIATSSKGPVTLVIMSAGGVDISFARNHPNITSIIWAGYPGEEGGQGIADVFGAYNPATTKRSINIKLNKFQHCRHINYIDGALEPSCATHNVEFSVEVTNVGKRDGSEVVMIYWNPPSGIVDAHIKQLVAFKKVCIQAGRSTKVNFNLNACKSLGIIDYKGYNHLASGGHNILVGDNILSFPLRITYEISH
ncbi:hypothetical protein ACH5RR_028800 [Cinchona calisaya]|uniref:Fibronectin type III-like domain-containing protein n=1 Tax=Cinchona calisaya TaxID=153742 RepID=A0ABD2YPU2_9GENT